MTCVTARSDGSPPPARSARLDPLLAGPAANTMLATLISFLSSLRH